MLILDIETKPDEHKAVLRLRNKHGEHLAARDVTVSGEHGFEWTGLFNTRQHVELYTGRLLDNNEIKSAEELLAELGVFLAEEVLGKDIFQHLYKVGERRTLLVQIPSTEGDKLAAAFARIPWEIARPSLDKSALWEDQAFAVRAITGNEIPQDREITLDLESDEKLRVLLIFSETEQSSPLAGRLERQELLDLFYDDILPNKLVQVDTICYGVTRDVILKQVRQSKGYHVVHWSGHGNHNSLLLAGEENDQISGTGLVELFQKAGGFVPKLMFLSACHSGDFFKPDSKPDLPGFQNLAGLEVGLEVGLDNYTSTALELLKAGISQVVAMRYSVGDEYARHLAGLFYKNLLAERQVADEALAMARGDLAEDKRFAAIEHVTPLLFGQDRLLLEAVNKRNAEQLKQRFPNERFQPLLSDGKYGFKARPNFVGRGRELTRLSRDWLDGKDSPVALVQGLAGLGKTALVAEVVNLWHGRFDLVLAVQSRGQDIKAIDFYKKIDLLLVRLSKYYDQDCQSNEYNKIFQHEDVSGRYEIMRENLLATLNDYPILLIIDNFETNLLEDNSCKDPEWTALLTMLVSRLRGGSRVIITCRHRIELLNSNSKADLSGFGNLVGLGPLPKKEAQLFLQGHEALNRLWHGDRDDKNLVTRVLDISHGHPLIMQRLGDLAVDRSGLVSALDSLEAKGFKHFSSLEDDAEEQKYLEDVAIGAVDLLLERLSQEGRRLLWVVTRALEDVPYFVLDGVWSGMSSEEMQLLQFIENPEVLEQLKQQLPPEQIAELEQLLEQIKNKPKPPAIGPLLKKLTNSGLLQQEGKREKAVYSFHELVRERCTVWMESHSEDSGELDAKQIGQAYGEQYTGIFKAVLGSDKTTATEMGRRAITYLVRAEAFEALAGFTSNVVVNTKNPQQLQAIIAELEAIVEQVPVGKIRWSMRTNLADALYQSGQPQLALPLYKLSASEAEAAENWADVATICQNWAHALRNVGQLPEARETFQRSAQAERKAGRSEVNIISSESEVLRIDIMLGEVKIALPTIEQHLAKLRDWWQQSQQGEELAAVPDTNFLARVFISGLDIARSANLQLKYWQNCLDLLTEIEQVEQTCGESEEVLARTWFNRYGPLVKLGRLDEAQQVLEDCLRVFTNKNDLTNQAKVLSALAYVWDECDDMSHAIEQEQQALAICERLPNPEDRATSHESLSIYLDKTEQTEEGAKHILAGIVYCIVMGNQQRLEHALGNLAIRMQEAKEKDTIYPLPKLNELLQLPEFSTLKRWLAEWGVNIGELQEGVDGVVGRIQTR
ncbi:CHAT domain-containing protein [Candidatus Halobeggiatoa sp. HSG11]|nr:CHAT domain-containing protein [Candidatus Halobeggiatoa sp. HSG11]